MPTNEKIQSRLQRPDLPDDLSERRRPYRVILDEVRADRETPDSFAIKFSLLTKLPITKTKHLIARFPATIWAGLGRQKAEHILNLIEEAGGRGRILDGDPEPVPPDSIKGEPSGADSSKGSEAPLTCRWCGFPLKEGDTFCEFCMTPVQEGEKSGGQRASKGRGTGIPSRRLFLYAAILVLGIIVILLVRYR
jgi:hypothetical protein